MTKYVLVSVVILFTSLSACDKSRLYETNIELDNKMWLADSISEFEFKIEDTTSRYNVFYNIRNSVSYPFQNIYVNYSLQDSTGKELSAALVNNNLFHPKTGKPYGDGLGDVLDHQFPLLKGYNFSKGGKYKLTLQQFMRRDTLPEILSVGVRVERDLTEIDN